MELANLVQLLQTVFNAIKMEVDAKCVQAAFMLMVYHAFLVQMVASFVSRNTHVLNHLMAFILAQLKVQLHILVE
jgi:hypothetical protein